MTVSPTIHLNGDTQETLANSYCEQRAAIVHTIEILLRNTPNGRNYYPQGEGATQQAIKEHYDRVQKLDDIKKELDTILEEVCK